MEKHRVFLAGTLIIALVAHACSMPSSMEIKTDNFRLSIPVKTVEFDIAAMLSGQLADSFPEGFEIYDMRDYTDSQAFLVAYKMKVMDSFNPGDYLDDLDMDDDDIIPDSTEKIESTIEIPALSPVPVSKPVEIGLDELLGTIEDAINDISVDSDTVLVIPNGDKYFLSDEFPALPPLIAWDSSGNNFTSVKVASGTLDLSLELMPNSFGVQNVEIEIDISLMGGADGNTPYNTDTVILNSGNSFKNNFSADLVGKEIFRDPLPRFQIHSIKTTNDGVPINPDLKMEAGASSIELRGVKGFELGEPIVLDEDVLDTIAGAIDLKTPPQLLNTEIKDGSLTITTMLPDPYTIPGTTYCDGLVVEYTFCVKQEAVIFEGKIFNGLSGGDEFWKIVGEGTENIPLAGKLVSGSDVSIVKGTGKSQVTVNTLPGGASFELYNGDYVEKALPVELCVDMEINELEVVRWKPEDDLFDIEDIEIDFTSMGGSTNLADFINSITFENITMGLDFTNPSDECGLPPALRDRLALKVSCPELGFINAIKVLNDKNGAPNPYLNELESSWVTLDLKAHPQITVTLDILPVIGSDWKTNTYSYMEFGPLVLGSDGTEMDLYAEPSFGFNWAEAEIDMAGALEETDLEELSGRFPEKEEDAINLYENMGKYMRGVSLGGNIETKIFFAGSHGLIDKMNPKMIFGAEWIERINLDDPDDEKHENWDSRDAELYRGSLTMYDLEKLPVLPDDLNGGRLPDGGMPLEQTINDVIAAFPRELYFHYSLDMGESMIVTPDMFDNDEEDKGLTVMFVMFVPLEFIVAEGGGFPLPDDIFPVDDYGNPKDLFGRDSPGGDSIFTNVNVKSLGIKIDFDDAFFRGAVLHLDGNPIVEERLFPGGMRLNNGNSMEIVLDNNDWKIIRDNLIYPKMDIEFPQAQTIKIRRNFLPTRITIAASGSYTFDIDYESLGL